MKKKEIAEAIGVSPQRFSMLVNKGIHLGRSSALRAEELSGIPRNIFMFANTDIIKMNLNRVFKTEL